MVGTIDIAELLKHPPFELSETDKEVLQTAEEDFVPHYWEDMKAIIAAGDMSLLRRTPADLFNYIRWTMKVRDNIGSVLSFIIQRRLHWKTKGLDPRDPFPCSSPILFYDDSDFKILRNDWPYGVEPGMVHLVVWTKTPIATDKLGDPTPQSRQLIDDFIQRTFKDHIVRGQYAGDNVQWFRNRTKWQSVRSLDHMHIVLRDIDEEFVTRITGQRPCEVICQTYESDKGDA